jgi:hypothetical protein
MKVMDMENNSNLNASTTEVSSEAVAASVAQQPEPKLEFAQSPVPGDQNALSVAAMVSFPTGSTSVSAVMKTQEWEQLQTLAQKFVEAATYAPSTNSFAEPPAHLKNAITLVMLENMATGSLSLNDMGMDSKFFMQALLAAKTPDIQAMGPYDLYQYLQTAPVLVEQALNGKAAQPETSVPGAAMPIAANDEPLASASVASPVAAAPVVGLFTGKLAAETPDVANDKAAVVPSRSA